jgi:hypothetical protein
MNITRFILGLVCWIVAIFPANLALLLFSFVTRPTVQSEPNVHVSSSLILYGHPLQGGALFAVLITAAFAALALLGGGLYLTLTRANQ